MSPMVMINICDTAARTSGTAGANSNVRPSTLSTFGWMVIQTSSIAISATVGSDCPSSLPDQTRLLFVTTDGATGSDCRSKDIGQAFSKDAAIIASSLISPDESSAETAPFAIT